MPELILWKKQEMDKLRRDIDSLFNQLWSDFGVSPLFSLGAMAGPHIEITETDDAIHAKAELPDINPQDLDISVSNDVLTIRGKKGARHVEGRGYYHRFARLSSFSRSIQLPSKIKVDDIQAHYKGGTLHIIMPKLKPDKMRIIEIEIK